MSFSPAKMWATKLQALRAYGGSCVCCGETEPVFLSFDHIGGGGNEHRRQDYVARKNIGLWLLRHGCPRDFQILCFNCHKAKDAGPGHMRGLCPHELRRNGVIPNYE